MKRSFLLSPFPYALIAVAVVLFFGFQYLLAPWLVRVAMNRLITKPCSHCSLQVSSITVQVFGPGFTLNGVRFSASAGAVTTIAAEIPSLSLKMYPLALFKRKLHLGPVELTGPVVNILEREYAVHREAQSEQSEKGDVIASLEVDGIVVHQGDFTFAHETGKEQGAVRVHDIDLQIQRFGTIPELRNQKFYGHAVGRLEKSGRFDLNASADFFSPAPDVDVELKLTGQNLADLNGYFDPADGIQLQGTLLDGHTIVAIDGATANSKANATFENLAFTAKKTEARSGFTAFLTNVMGDLAMAGHNKYDKPEDKTQTATIQREPGQTVIAFILHSMKAAALKIPTRKR